MKKPKWLEKEKLYSIMFESDVPMGRIFDLVLIVAISLSIIISFIETIPELARTFKLTLEVLEYLLTFFFTLEYIARVYCSPRPKDYVLSFFGIIDLLAIMPPYLSYFFPRSDSYASSASSNCSITSMKDISCCVRSGRVSPKSPSISCSY